MWDVDDFDFVCWYIGGMVYVMCVYLRFKGVFERFLYS